jgi:hypothetical protein
MMNFQNPIYQSMMNFNKMSMVPQDQQANNILLAKLILQNRLLAMRNANMPLQMLQRINEQPEKKMKVDDNHLNMAKNMMNDAISLSHDDSLSTASHVSPVRSPLHNIQIPSAVKGSFKPMVPAMTTVQKTETKLTLNTVNSPVLSKVSGSFEDINKKRLRSELEESPRVMIETRSVESDEELSEAKKGDEMEIKNLMEQYNEMIAEKKRLRKMKRKETAPPKKGRLRKLMDPEPLENEVKAEESQNNEASSANHEEENQF